MTTLNTLLKESKKICPRCGLSKSLSDYRPRKNHGGFGPYCKECSKEYVQHHYLTNKETYRLNAKKNYILAKSSNYDSLHKDWVKHNYAIAFSPTVDRIDNKGNYSISNIQFLKQRDNILKRWRVDYA